MENTVAILLLYSKWGNFIIDFLKLIYHCCSGSHCQSMDCCFWLLSRLH